MSWYWWILIVIGILLLAVWVLVGMVLLYEDPDNWKAAIFWPFVLFAMIKGWH